MSEAAILKARAIVAGALACDIAAVPADSGMATLPQWDSMAHMTIVLGLEEVLGSRLKPEEIAGIGSVADIAALLARAG